jgi:hypothetical protein
MLVIRHKQMEVLNTYRLNGFEDRMVGYLAKRFPDACGVNNEPAVRRSIQEGILRAKGYGIIAEYDVARYIELMHLFSEDFDTSSATPWANPILEDATVGSHVKMNLLWEKAYGPPPSSIGDR